MSFPLIIIPKPIPPGYRVSPGETTPAPTCDRCLRTATDMNPIWLTERKCWVQDEHALGRRRQDAICYECRLLMKGRC